VLGCEVAANGDRDGIPNVLLESMAMGVPVVATSVSAIPELVQNGETGLLVPPRDPEKLARAVARLLTDTRLREEIVAKARERVIRYFDNRQHIRQLVEIYRHEIPAFGKT
jgi:glycosyltransferase involved in cell wall biosynthesis